MALRSLSQTMRLPMRVWDLPTRLFHWIVVLLVAVSYLSIQFDYLRLHFVSGYAMTALLLFRLMWGVVGSQTARFSAFVRSPIAGLRHLARFGRRDPDDQVGHNEAGGWMVLLMLALLAVQVGTGLCANDDVAVEGPLAKYVGKSLSDRLTDIHAININILLAAIAVHVLVIIAYRVVKKHDLIRPMITGKKRLPAITRAPRMASPLLAALIMVVAAAAVWALATFA